MNSNKKLKQLYLVRRIILVTLVLFVVVVVIMNAANFSADNFKRFTAEIRSAFQGSAAEQVDLTENSLSQTGVFKNGIVRLAPNAVTVYGKDFTKYSSHTVSLSTPVLRVSKNFILAFDRGGSTAYVLDSFRILHTFTGLDTIVNAGISDDGHLFMITQKYGYKNNLTVYNSAFQDVFTWDATEHYLLDGVFCEKNTIAVCATDIDTGQIAMNMFVYRINYQTAQQTDVQSLTDSMYVSCAVGNDQAVRVMTDKGIFRVPAGSVETVVAFDGVEVGKFDLSETYMAYVKISDLATARQSLTVLDASGKALFEKEFYQITDLIVTPKGCFVLTPEALTLLDYHGQEVSSVQTDGTAVQVCWAEGNIVLIYADRAQKIDITQ